MLKISQNGSHFKSQKSHFGYFSIEQRTEVERITDGNTTDRTTQKYERAAHDVHIHTSTAYEKEYHKCHKFNHSVKMCHCTSKAVNMFENAISDYTYTSDSDVSETGESNAVVGTVTSAGVLEDEWTVKLQLKASQ